MWKGLPVIRCSTTVNPWSDSYRTWTRNQNLRKPPICCGALAEHQVSAIWWCFEHSKLLHKETVFQGHKKQGCKSVPGIYHGFRCFPSRKGRVHHSRTNHICLHIGLGWYRTTLVNECIIINHCPVQTFASNLLQWLANFTGINGPASMKRITKTPLNHSNP